VGLGFAQVLRSMLRQDPDVMVVGEMRDDETAQIALESAMTGHLLLTSLHANNSVAALARLENLGCSRAMIAQSVHLVLVQRLVRRLCSNCRKLDPVLPVLHASLVARRIIGKDDVMLPRPVGCDACAGTGYVGRAAVLECLQMTDGLREAVSSGKSFAEVRNDALADGALLPAVDYARFLLQKQIISASEVLISLADLAHRPKATWAFDYFTVGRTVMSALSVPGTLPAMSKRLLSGTTSTTVRFCTVRTTTPM